MTEEGPSAEPTLARRVAPQSIEKELAESFISYSMSVIVQRALPDVRDGLKPVHRRILYAMHEAGLGPSRPYRKCATVVGDVIGKYHPHGDGAVYDSLVRMAQDFSLRHPLVDGQGNFGSLDGDSAAAYRYTEARLAGFATTLLDDIDKETVDHAPNFDDRLEEPTVLPSTLPNLLVNGASGIAVGMATNIPPHNLREVAAACARLIEDDFETSVDELMEIVRGPDFPTGAAIWGLDGVRDAYREGRGRVVMRATAEMEAPEGARERIIVREIPFMVNKSRIIEQIVSLVREKKVMDVHAVRDESNREGVRIVIELKRDAVPQVVLHQLYKGTQLQSTFGVIMLALVDGVPRVMNLREMLVHFLDHRHEVVERRTRFDHRVARDREHVLEGLKIAVDHIDEVIAIIRGSSASEVAGVRLRERFELSERQAGAILNMRLARLTGLEIDKLESELAEVRAQRELLEEILASRARRMSIVGEELAAAVEKYGDERRTEIVRHEPDTDPLNLIANEPMVITVSHEGYLKRIHLDEYRRQARGGRGIIGTRTKEGDWVEHLFVAWTHDHLLFFTRGGRLLRLRVHRLPEASRMSRGKPMVNLLPAIDRDDKVASILRVRDFTPDRYLIFATRKGVVKRTNLSLYRNVHRGGLRAVRVREGDELIDVQLSEGSNEVVLATARGMAIRFAEHDARDQGRVTFGVRGIRLRKKDEVVGMAVARRGGTILTATRFGLAKRSEVGDYRLQRRGGKGVINMKLRRKGDRVAMVREVVAGDELVVVTRSGVVNRQGIDEVRVTGRSTQGVRLVRLGKGDELVGLARVRGELEVVDDGDDGIA